MKVLLVDDSDLDSLLLSSILARKGILVDRIANPACVLENIGSTKYDMVFLDLVMPEPDGYKILRSIRKDPEIANIYVVICSAKSTPLEIKYGLKFSNDYLAKPVTNEKIENVLSNFTIVRR